MNVDGIEVGTGGSDGVYVGIRTRTSCLNKCKSFGECWRSDGGNWWCHCHSHWSQMSNAKEEAANEESLSSDIRWWCIARVGVVVLGCRSALVKIARCLNVDFIGGGVLVLGHGVTVQII